MRTQEQSNIKPVFVGWDRPILWSFIDWLKAQTNSTFDYSDFIIIVPSKRAQSRISELLILDAKESKTSIISPKFYPNISACLNDYIRYQGTSPITITESLIAWEESINQYDNVDTTAKFISAEHLAIYLEKLRKDLLNYNLKIDDVIENAQELLSDSQKQLCKELIILNRLYEDTLGKYNFYDDLREITFTPPQAKYLFIGFHYLSPLEKFLINKFNLNSFNIIGAPQSESESFESDGSLNPSIWAQKSPTLNVNIAANPFVEIDSIKSMLLNAKSDDISLSLLDETLIGPLQTSLLSDNINALPLGSKPFTNSLWGSWVLALIGCSLEGTERIRSFFEHPLSSEMLLEKDGPNILVLLDKIITSSAQEVESLEDLLKYLTKEQSAQTKDIFSFAFKKLEQDSDLESYSKALIERLTIALSSITKLEHQEDILVIVKELTSLINSPLKNHKLELKDFYKILRDRFINIDSTFQTEKSFPIIGWQETYLDDASIIIVSDCIEGKLPNYPTQDPIITEQIKSLLGLPTRDFYNARDNFILSYLTHSKEKTLFFAPKEASSGDLNKLSKLCLSGLDDIEFINTLNKFYGSKHTSIDKITNSKLNKTNPLPLPPQIPYKEFPLESKTISATQIRDYLRCPYHFYLNHILKIRVEDYMPEELPGRITGQILHDVFARIGAQILINRPETKGDLLKRAKFELERLIAPYLRNREKAQIYALQASYLENKVQAYVDYEWQTLADSPSKIHTEVNAINFLPLTLPNGEVIDVKARIDRIEEYDDHIKIVDFKTGDTPLKIGQCFKKGQWLDPQLPIYGIFTKNFIPEVENKPIELQLVNFSKNPETNNQKIELSISDIESVKLVSGLVVTSILNADFYPPLWLDSPLLERLAGDTGGIF